MEIKSKIMYYFFSIKIIKNQRIIVIFIIFRSFILQLFNDINIMNYCYSILN